MKWRPALWLLVCALIGLLAACDSQASAPTPAPITPTVATPPTSAPAEATVSPTEISPAPAGGTETIRLYSSLPRIGSLKNQTDSIVNSIHMRLAEANSLACGGQFKLDYLDVNDGAAATGLWEEGLEIRNANQAVGDPDVMIYIGPFDSSAAKVSIPILNRAGMVMISPSNTYTGLTRPNPAQPDEPGKYYPTGQRNYTRVVTADDVQGDAGARWAQKLGIKKVYILDDQQVYGQSVANAFEKTAKEIDIEVLGHESIDGGAEDYTSLMTKIKGLGPDMVYFGGGVDSNAGQLLKDLRAVGMTLDKVKFMGPDGIDNQTFIDAAGADVAEGTYITIAGLPAGKLGTKGQEFYKKYREQFGSDAGPYGIYGYEAANVALAALNAACKKDRAAIRDAVFATKDFDGVLGRWSFDPNGDTTLADIQGHIVEGGKLNLEANLFSNGAWEK